MDENVTKERLLQWVKFSCYLDLWQDEEGDTDQDISRIILDRDDSHCEQMRAWFTELRDEAPLGAFLFWQERNGKLPGPDHAGGAIWEPLTASCTPEEAWIRFRRIKAWRVAAALVYSRECGQFCSRSDAGSPNDIAGHATQLVASYKAYVDWLDQIAAFCGVVLYRVDQARKKFIKEGKDLTSWNTLWMLFHSELCATSKPDLSLAHTTAARLEDYEPLVAKDVFEDIIRHNRGRGLLHQNRYAEATAVLDFWVDRKDRGSQSIPLGLWRRLVYYPAIRTLADAFEHMHRRAEAAWYLEGGSAASAEEPYWREVLRLELSRMQPWREFSRASGFEQSRQLKRLEVEATIAREEWKLIARGSAGAVRWKDWADGLGWTLRWHFADSEEKFLRRVRGVAETVARVGGAIYQLEGEAVAQPFLVKLLHLARTLLEARRTRGQRAIRFLVPAPAPGLPSENPPQPKRMYHQLLWDTLNLLIIALDRMKGNDAKLQEWSSYLLDLLDTYQNEFGETVARSLLVERLSVQSKARMIKCAQNPRYAHYVKRRFSCRLMQHTVRHRWRALVDLAVASLQKGFGGAFRHTNTALRAPACSAGPCVYGRNGCAVAAIYSEGAVSEGNSAGLDYLLTTMAANQAQYRGYLEGHTAELLDPKIPRAGPITPLVEFISLRRWNSFSPNLNSLSTVTVGGGYLLRVWGGEALARYIGIVIDPGYNYLQNLFNEGFTIADLDVVVVTHAHPDHTDNVSNLLTLLREQMKRASNSGIRAFGRPVSFVVSEGVFHRTAHLLDDEKEFIRDVVVVSWESSPGNRAGRNPVLVSESDGEVLLRLANSSLPNSRPEILSVRAIPAYHTDGTNADSMGVLLEAGLQRIGVLSDSRYHEGVARNLRGCDLAVIHVGALLDEAQYSGFHLRSAGSGSTVPHLEVQKPGTDHQTCDIEAEDCAQETLFEKVLLKKNHLYLPGLTRLLCDLKRQCVGEETPPLVVLSEFGEEMRGGLRVDLAQRMRWLCGANGPPIECLPADVGLRIDVGRRTTRCSICLRYQAFSKIVPLVVSPGDEAISYICKDCERLRGGELKEIVLHARMHPKQLKKIQERISGSASGGSEVADRQPPAQA